MARLFLRRHSVVRATAAGRRSGDVGFCHRHFEASRVVHTPARHCAGSTQCGPPGAQGSPSLGTRSHADEIPQRAPNAHGVSALHFSPSLAYFGRTHTCVLALQMSPTRPLQLGASRSDASQRWPRSAGATHCPFEQRSVPLQAMSLQESPSSPRFWHWPLLQINPQPQRALPMQGSCFFGRSRHVPQGRLGSRSQKPPEHCAPSAHGLPLAPWPVIRHASGGSPRSDSQDAILASEHAERPFGVVALRGGARWALQLFASTTAHFATSP